jgi:hypothetical protein
VENTILAKRFQNRAGHATEFHLSVDQTYRVLYFLLWCVIKCASFNSTSVTWITINCFIFMDFSDSQFVNSTELNRLQSAFGRGNNISLLHIINQTPNRVVLRREQFQSSYCTHRAMWQLALISNAPDRSEHSSQRCVVASCQQIRLGAVGNLELFPFGEQRYCTHSYWVSSVFPLIWTQVNRCDD